MDNKMKILVYCLALFALLFAGKATSQAGGFQDHPRDFLFGNHIDTHQQNKLKLFNSEMDLHN